jgi:hypothetical protein
MVRHRGAAPSAGCGGGMWAGGGVLQRQEVRGYCFGRSATGVLQGVLPRSGSTAAGTPAALPTITWARTGKSLCLSDNALFYKGDDSLTWLRLCTRCAAAVPCMRAAVSLLCASHVPANGQPASPATLFPVIFCVHPAVANGSHWHATMLDSV